MTIFEAPFKLKLFVLNRLFNDKLPENNEGIVGEETIEVRYYYLSLSLYCI